MHPDDMKPKKPKENPEKFYVIVEGEVIELCTEAAFLAEIQIQMQNGYALNDMQLIKGKEVKIKVILDTGRQE